MPAQLKRKDLIYSDLSYRIMGVLFQVWTDLGFGHKENFYQKAVATVFAQSGIEFKEQLPAKIRYKGKIIGTYFFDFLIDNKIILELKAREYFSKKDISQLCEYLKVQKLKLGIIAHFTRTGIKFKRVVNIK